MRWPEESQFEYRECLEIAIPTLVDTGHSRFDHTIGNVHSQDAQGIRPVQGSSIGGADESPHVRAEDELSRDDALAAPVLSSFAPCGV